MRPDDLLDAMEYIGDDLVQEANIQRNMPRRWMRWGSIAVCLCCAAVGLGLLLGGPRKTEGRSMAAPSPTETAKGTTPTPAPTPVEENAVRPAVNSDHDRTWQDMTWEDGVLYFCDGDSLLSYHPDTGGVRRICNGDWSIYDTTEGAFAIASGSRELCRVTEQGLEPIGTIGTDQYETVTLLDVADGVAYWLYRPEAMPEDDGTENVLGETDLESGEQRIRLRTEDDVCAIDPGGRVYFQNLTAQEIWCDDPKDNETADGRADTFRLEDVQAQVPEDAQWSRVWCDEEFALLEFIKGNGEDALPTVYYFRVEPDGTVKQLYQGNTQIAVWCRYGNLMYFESSTPILWSGTSASFMTMDLNTGEMRTLVPEEQYTNQISMTELSVSDYGIYYYTPYGERGIYRLDPDTGKSTRIY